MTKSVWKPGKYKPKLFAGKEYVEATDLYLKTYVLLTIFYQYQFKRNFHFLREISSVSVQVD